ncbi:MAG TPA: DUF4403 family protein [Nitrospira sp.]|nr:DUF4403 family protein [Nitrospira sp.]
MLSLIFVAFLLAGCGGSTVVIPRPTDPLKPPPPAPIVEQSVVHLPISLPVDELAFAAEAAVPSEAAKEEAWLDGGILPDHSTVQYRYRMVRGPLALQAIDNRLLTRFPDIQYRMAVRMGLREGGVIEDGCGYGTDPPKRLRLTAQSVLTWTDAWRVAAATSFDPPEYLDSCRLMNLDADVTPVVQMLVEERLRSVAEAIDAKVRERSESQKRAEAIWRNLQEPVELAPNVWLSLNPFAAQISPISAEGERTFKTSLNLRLQPSTHFGAKPAWGDHPLPRLELSPLSLEGFHLAVPVMAEYSVLNERLQQRLVGRELPSSFGETVTIISCQLYGSGEDLILELGVTGTVIGKLYAKGRPRFDEKARSLTFEHFDYTVDTKNVLIRMGNWLLREDILSRVKPFLDIDLSDRLESLRRRVSAGLNRELAPGVWLEGDVTTFHPRDIYPVADGVEVRLVADGMLELSVR